MRLKKVKGTENEADMGTKDLDGPTDQRLLQKLLLKPTQCSWLLRLITAACGGDVSEARVEVDEGASWTLLAQVTIALSLVILTYM